jgi:hypothetical protein
MQRKEKILVALVLLHTFATREVLYNASTMNPWFIYGFGAYVIAFSFFTYYCMIADASESRLAYLFTVDFPEKLRKKAAGIIGEDNVDILAAVGDRFLAMVYVTVVCGSWIVIFTDTYPWIDESEGYLSSYHKILGVVVFATCIASWRYACKQSPGIITSHTLELYDNFPYDGVLFVKDRICPTVGIRKLARSKYDRFQGIHVSKFDHFCGWLYNSVGEQNYRWFLLFLVVHIGMCIYGTVVVGYLFHYEIHKEKLWDVTFYNRVSGEEFKATAYVVFQFLFQKHKLQAGLLMLMSVMAFVLALFLGYHIWITSRGMTTNETVKWDQVKKWHKSELKRYKEAVKEGRVSEKGDTVYSKPIVSDGDVTCTGAAGTIADAKKTEENAEEMITHPGPMPKNIYNNGLVENWRDVFYPRSMRPEAIARHRKAAKARGTKPPIDPKKPKAS